MVLIVTEKQPVIGVTGAHPNTGLSKVVSLSLWTVVVTVLRMNGAR